MSDDLERQPPQTSTGHDVDRVLPAQPVPVCALVIDYTSMTMEQLEDLQTLIGGGNGPVIKLDSVLLADEATQLHATKQLVNALLAYPCTMLFLLVPWGMPNVKLVIEVMTHFGRQRPFVTFEIGGELYSVELSMATGSVAEIGPEIQRLLEGVRDGTEIAEGNL